METAVYSEMASLESTHWWFVARRQILSKVIAGLKLPPDAKILDVGCGTGGNLPLLAEFGQVSGIEMNETALEHSTARGIGEVRLGSLPDDIPYPDSLFDLAVFLDILEHVESETEGLAEAARKVKPGGNLLITVPAMPVLWGPHDVRHHHKRRYTKLSLERLVREAGLQLNYLTYFNTLLFPIILGVRLLQKLTGANTDHGIQPPSPWLNAILTRIFASERRVIGDGYIPLGLSLLALAEKPTELSQGRTKHL